MPHRLVIENGTFRTSKYWEVFYERDFDHAENYFVDRTLELLDDSVRVHTRADVLLGAYFSGGIDSGLVGNLGAEYADLLHFTGFVDAGATYDERVHAQAVSDQAGATLLEVEIRADHIPKMLPEIIYHRDYPVAGPGVIPQYVVSEFASRERKVVLGGQSGDEMFGGYVRCLRVRRSRLLTGIDHRLTHPLRQRHRMDPAVISDLLERHAIVAVAGHANDIFTELTGIGLGHGEHPSRPAEARQSRCHLSVRQTRHCVQSFERVVEDLPAHSEGSTHRWITPPHPARDDLPGRHSSRCDGRLPLRAGLGRGRYSQSPHSSDNGCSTSRETIVPHLHTHAACRAGVPTTS